MKRIKWAIFDVDGTLTQVRSVWEYLLKAINRWHDWGEPNLKAFLDGMMDYNEFARRDALAFKGLTKRYMMELMDGIPRRKGWVECFNCMKNKGIKIALVSTGLDILVNLFDDVDYKVSNALVFDRQQRCTGDVVIHIPIHGKKQFLDEFLHQKKVSYENIVVVGDGVGDIDIMAAAGTSVAVNPSGEEIASVADFVLPGKNLMNIPVLLELSD